MGRKVLEAQEEVASEQDQIRSERSEFRSINDPILFYRNEIDKNEMWENWQVRSGMIPESHMPVSRSGLYTDFT